MPIYQFRNTESGEEFEDILSISEKEDLLSKNPHIKQVPTSFAIVSGVGSLDSKTDDTWKEVLAKVAEAHPNSEVGERYGKKTHKQVKTQQVFEKWKNR
jgi:hypothetical protein